MTRKTQPILLILGLLVLLGSPASIGAAEQPDAAEAFRIPGGEAQWVLASESSAPYGTAAGSAWFL